MALDSLTALANTGTGTSALAGRDVGGKFAGAAILVDENGLEISGANPLDVAMAGAASEATLAGLGTEDMLVAILYELRQINEKSGTKDGTQNIRVALQGPIPGPLASVTAVGTITTLTNLAQIGAVPASTFVADQMNKVAALIYYPNLVVS
jgi:hypothetical protein